MRHFLALFIFILAFAEPARGAPSPAVCARVGQAKCEAYHSAKTNWAAFYNALLANQAQRALTLVHPGCVEEFRDTLLAPDADLVKFAKSVIEFEVVDSPLLFEGASQKGKGYITAVLILKTEEGKQMFNVTFAQDRENSWKLCTM